MITRVGRLLSLKVTHTYYGGLCRDFTFTVPGDTARVLRGGRLFPKVLEGELVVAYEMNAAGSAPRIQSAGKRLRFGLRLANPHFEHFTLLPTVPAGATGVIRVYRNGTSPGALDGPEVVPCTPAVFAHRLGGTTRPVTVSAIRAGAALRTDRVDDGRETASFDLRGVDPGRFEVVEAFAGGATQTTAYYLDPEAKRDGAFAIVELDVAASFYALPPAFEVAFDAREETLKYYIVVTNYSSADFAALSVQDAGFVDDGRPEITFAKVASSSFGSDDMPPDTLSGPGSRLVLFKSQSPVRRRALGRRKLQLKKNGDALVEQLPQPGSANPTSDLVIHLSKPKRA